MGRASGPLLWAVSLCAGGRCGGLALFDVFKALKQNIYAGLRDRRRGATRVTA
jgi:hypothetical protein